MERETPSEQSEFDNDSEFRSMVSDLTTLYKCPVPTQRIQAVVQSSLSQNRPVSRTAPALNRKWLKWIPNMRLEAILPAALAVVFLVAATSAASSLVERALNLSPAAQPVLSGNLGEHVHLSQTVQGFTVTVERIYASSKLVIVGYTIKGPSERSFVSFEPFAGPRSENSRMPTLREHLGVELRGTPNSWTTGVQNGAIGGLLVYDTGTVRAGTRVLHLHLTMPAVSAIERTGNHLNSFRFVTVRGPFVFQLRVPLRRNR